MLKNNIEIMDADLVLKHQDVLLLIDYWKKTLGIMMGWHYDLDFIWILNNLSALSLRKGQVIVDAGAGNGLLQFLLASRGYNILSLDYADRHWPPGSSRIFKMRKREHFNEQTYRYQRFMTYPRDEILTRDKLIKGIRNPAAVLQVANERYGHYLNLSYWMEVLKRRINEYGSIDYIKIDFNNMAQIEDKSVDCIVSVSAIEHNGHDDIKKAVREFERILKDGACMIVTTSAAKGHDWYFKACEGWCFASESLKELFDMKACDDNYDRYDEFLDKLRNSDVIKKRIARGYFRSGDNGLPWGICEPKYQPVGIVKRAGS